MHGHADDMQEVQAAHSIYEYVRDGGMAAVLAFFIFGGWKGWWIWGSQLTRERMMLETQRDQLMRERDAWQRLALGATLTAEKAVDHAASIQKTA